MQIYNWKYVFFFDCIVGILLINKVYSLIINIVYCLLLNNENSNNIQIFELFQVGLLIKDVFCLMDSNNYIPILFIVIRMTFLTISGNFHDNIFSDE